MRKSVLLLSCMLFQAIMALAVSRPQPVPPTGMEEVPLQNAGEENQVTADYPIDKTSSITNAGYEEKKAGWNDTDDRWMVQDGVSEHYAHTFNHCQTIGDIPNGLYRVNVQGFYRAKANAEHPEEYAAFYAISGNDSIAEPLPEWMTGATEEPLADTGVSNEEYGYVPKWPIAVDAYFKAGKYEVEYYIHVIENRVRLGVTLTDDNLIDWVTWDNWRLTYYGTDTEAYEKGLIAGMVEENMNRFDDRILATTIGTVENYKAILAGLIEDGVSDINVAKGIIKKATDDVENNIDAWSAYQEEIRKAESFVGMPEIVWNDICRDLDDYLKTTVKKHVEERTLTSEEVRVAASELNDMTRLAINNQISGNNITKTWSYVSFDRTNTDENGNFIESNDYNRYTSITTLRENVGRMTYYKLVNHKTCEYDQEKNAKTYRIRYEGKRIYLLKEDTPDYKEAGIILKEEGDDYVLYDFGLEVGDEYCKMFYHKDTVSVRVTEISSVTTTDGEARKAFKLSVGNGWIIDGIGSTGNFIYPVALLGVACDCGVVLNLYREESLFGYLQKEYRNPFGDIVAQSTAFKENDCALGADAVEQAVIKNNPIRVQASGNTLTCTAPNAIKLEVYTTEAMKVGETEFTNGTATVKVGKVPAAYLYIVTYPNGRRESGKVMVKE